MSPLSQALRRCVLPLALKILFWAAGIRARIEELRLLLILKEIIKKRKGTGKHYIHKVKVSHNTKKYE